MATRQAGGGIVQDVEWLYESGTAVGLTDGELLDRFIGRSEPGGDRGAPAGHTFTAMVERHGPMVLRICRAILRNEQDAQDAFQAAFLVLLVRAGAVRRRESIASWLHGVALRVSRRARVDQARRRRHEREAGTARASRNRSSPETIDPEAVAMLHEELGRLPDRYRAAVVLCYLEGHTCEAAARRLGWPVGTVKSRLARGRERLRGRLIRRGLAPEGTMDRATDPAVLLPAALSRATSEAMLRLAAGMPDIAPATVLSWADHALKTMQMTRRIVLSALLIVGLAATGAAMWIARAEDPSGDKPAAAGVAATPRQDVAAPAAAEDSRTFGVRVVDTQGRGVPGVDVEVIEEDAIPLDDGHGSRLVIYRTGADGRVRIAVDRRFIQLGLEARPGEGTFGWASLRSGDAWLKSSEESPIRLTLLPRNHLVEGTILDSRGKPIGGGRVRMAQIRHEDNGVATDDRSDVENPSLGSAVTDDAGRYRFSFPAETSVILGAYHPRYVGPWFSCGPDDRTIAPITMEDAGGIAGTVVDAATGRPIAGAEVNAGNMEFTGRILGGGGGRAASDGGGHFLIGGLAPGVYNVVFRSSPRGRRFIARSVEGVRVQAGREARADLRLIEGRRLEGTAIYAATGEPVAGVGIDCYYASGPRSGAGSQTTYTNDRGRFEVFVPPGPAFVHIQNGAGPGSAAQKTVSIPEDRDPAPIILKRGHDPDAPPAPRPRPPVECEVRVRVKTEPGERSKPGDDRTLTGRLFDASGAPIPAVRVDCLRGQTLIRGATDRMGLFRLKAVPRGPIELSLVRNEEESGRAMIPAEAVEVDVIFMAPPGRAE